MRHLESGCRPLTPMQAAMALASVRDPRTGVYIVQDVCRSPEALDLSRLRQAWNTVAARHPALRTRIEVPAEGPPVQWVDASGGAEWIEATYPQDLEEFLRHDRERGFDFTRGVPIRFILLSRPGQGSVLVWTSHHALLDGFSYSLVWREWLELYRDPSASLPEAVPFAAYLDWRDSRDYRDGEPFWRRQLEGLRRTTGFIADRLRTGGEGPARESIVLSPEITAAVHAFARAHDLTAGAILQSAWALLLGRYAAAPDVVFGVTRAGRRSGPPGADRIAGPLFNTLPFRIRVDPEMRVLPWLRQAREQMIALRPFEHMPVGLLREWNLLPAASPPFDTLFVYEPARPGEALREFGVEWARVQRTDTPLTFAAAGAPRLTFDLAYDARLFCRETVAGIAGHLQTLVEGFIARPGERLSALSLLTARERHRLDQRNRTPPPSRSEACVHQLWEQAVDRHRDAPAIDHPGGIISFADLNARANRIARLLREQGAGAEDLVAVALDRSPDAVAAVLAVLKSGAAFVLLPPYLPEARLGAMLQQVRPRLTVTHSAFEAKFPPGSTLCLDLHEPAIARRSAANPDGCVTPDHAAYAALTSGSTGRPKAVVLTHRALANHTRALGGIYGVAAGDRRVQFASLGSDMFVSEIFTFLCSGAALVFCLDPAGNSMTEFLRLIDLHRITITGMPSSWWHTWVAAIESGEAAIPASLRLVVTGMERLDPAALAVFRRVAGGRPAFINAYGPTETCPVATTYQAGSSPWESPSLAPIGKPIAGNRVYVLDEHGSALPDGVPGEIYIAGRGVGRGYLHEPELTAARFVPEAGDGDPAARMFRTGDRGFFLPDGNLVFLGRLDRQVKIRGYRVEPEEIEAALAEHPGVRQCAVVAHENHGHSSLAAYLAPAAPGAPPIEDLRRHLLERLPDYMMPSSFTVLARMPLTGSGKIDRLALPAPAPPASEFVAPSTQLERQLALFFQESLGLAAVSAAANFFESGGDSLRATQLVLRIRRELGRDLPFALFLKSPTIAHVAVALRDSLPAPAGPVVLSHNIQGARPPLFLVTSLPEDLYVFRHLTRHLDREQPVYVLNVPLREDEDAPAMEELAARVCGTVAGLRPRGPYILGGYCFGGILAFEAARRLGDDVPLVILFDTPAPTYPRLLGSPRMAAQWKRLGRRARGIGPATAAAGGVHEAALHYVPRPIRARLAQFMAGDQPVTTRLLQDPRLAWRALCKGRFAAYRVPGDHVTWLEEPHAAAAAARLSEALRAASLPILPITS